MKKGIIFLLILSSVKINAQVETYTTWDGTSVDLEVVNSNPDDGRKACIYYGRFGFEGANRFGANYYSPNKFFVNGLFGSTGGIIDFSLLLLNRERTVTAKPTVKISRNTKYKAKIKIPSNLSIGPHIGVSMTDYSNFSDGDLYGVGAKYYDYSTKSISLGLSILGAKHLHLKTHDMDALINKGRGTLIHRISIDGIYYFDQTLPNNADVGASINDFTREIGYRIYYDAKITLMGPFGVLGFNYMIGYGANSQKEGFPLFMGLGVGVNFL